MTNISTQQNELNDISKSIKAFDDFKRAIIEISQLVGSDIPENKADAFALYVLEKTLGEKLFVSLLKKMNYKIYEKNIN